LASDRLTIGERVANQGTILRFARHRSSQKQETDRRSGIEKHPKRLSR
jgi:hypothetical protein